MSGPSYLTRRDLPYALWILIGSSAVWFMPYAGSRWMPEAGPGFLMVYAIGIIVVLTAAAALLLRPFATAPRDFRWTQWLLRLGILAALWAIVKFQSSGISPAGLGKRHRLADRGKVEDFRAVAKGVLQEAATPPAVAQPGQNRTVAWPATADGRTFPSIAQIWGEPDSVEIGPGSDSGTVSFIWGGGFGHWGVLVRFDAVPLVPDDHLEVWKWDEGVFFWREIQ